MENIAFSANPALPEIPQGYLEGAINTLGKYLPRSLLEKEVLPLCINFNDELLVCIDRRSKCVDPMESAELTKLWDYIMSQATNLDCYGCAPLRLAFAMKDLECIDSLLDSGADFQWNYRMHFAAIIGSPYRVSMLKRYMKCGVKVHTSEKWHALYFALQAKNIMAINHFCKKETAFMRENFQSFLKMAPEAVYDMKLIQLMLDLAYWVNWIETYDRLKLSGTTISTITDMVRNNVVVYLKQSIELDETGSILNTVYRIAAVEGQLDVLKMCMSMNVDIRHIDNREVIYLALLNGHLTCVEFIAERMTQEEKTLLMLTALETGEPSNIRSCMKVCVDCEKVFNSTNVLIRRLASDYYWIYEGLEKDPNPSDYKFEDLPDSDHNENDEDTDSNAENNCDSDSYPDRIANRESESDDY